MPNCVVKEHAKYSKTLADSKYRVVGKLTGNSKLVTSWVNKGESMVHGNKNEKDEKDEK